jgi:hypothetical protein
MSDFPYRLKKDNYHSWAILRRDEIPDVGRKTGKPTKNAGQVKWTPFKYPGNMLQAAQTLMELADDPEAEVGSIDELIKIVHESEQRVLAAIREWRNERMCPVCTKDDEQTL